MNRATPPVARFNIDRDIPAIITIIRLASQARVSCMLAARAVFVHS